ncbi:protein FAR1-RELATED SEQUENCE 7-like [Mangifera indica]|uniref:protein FAR1-RELATED SEQUENCE 7-like n=1 Tax=Mangifera indica TaxID=29780 RepID=UPI001CF9ED9A|nr:protein FAR1-RELATED SEQUENCE 7-like [Mangifera indica]
MAGSTGHDYVDSDGGSDNESFGNFDDHETSEDGLLQCYDSQSVVQDDLNLMIPSVEGFTAESSGSIEPYAGMTFRSLDDARDFYYEYAKNTGFTIRTNRIRHSLKNMAIIGRDFVCSREGFRAAKHTLRKDRILPPRPVTREGCKAMIRLAARDGGKWIVTKFVREHNHKLMTHCKFPGELPIVNILSEEEKDKKIQDLYNELQHERERSAAVQQQLCMILKELEEHAEFMSIRVEDIVNKLKEIELDDL